MAGEKRTYAHHTSFLSALKNKLHGRHLASQLSEEDDHLLQSFEMHLTSSLEAVHKTSDIELWSLHWLDQLMVAMLEASLFLQKMFLTKVLGHLTRRDEKLLNAFLDSNAKYLDACNAMREGMGRLETLQMYVKSSLNVFGSNKGSLSEPQLNRARKYVHECFLELRSDESQREMSITQSLLQAISEKLFPPKNNEMSSSLQAFAIADYATNVISLFALGTSLAALMPGKKTHIVENFHVSRHHNWSSQLLSLQEEVKQSAGTKKGLQRGLLRELDMLSACLSRLSIVLEAAIPSKAHPMSPEQEQQLFQAVEELRHISQDLEDGLRAMDNTICKLFRQLISCRNAVLDLLSLAMS